MHRFEIDRPRRLRRLGLLLLPLGLSALAGCAVVSVAGTAVSVGVGAAGLAASAAVGAAKITGKAVGAAVDAVSDDDNSGINVRFREPTAADREKRRMAEQQAEEYERNLAEEKRAQEAARRQGPAPQAPMPPTPPVQRQYEPSPQSPVAP